MDAPEILTTRTIQKEENAFLNRIASDLYEQIRNLKTHKGNKMVSYQSIRNFLQEEACEGNLYGFFDHNHRLVGAVCSLFTKLWWSGNTALTEVFVVCLKKDFAGFGRQAADHLLARAKAGCASLVETAAAMTDEPQLVENLYMEKKHFDFSYPAFIKVLPVNCGT